MEPFAELWTVRPEWAGETCFVVAGGPSLLALDVSRLADRRVIAVNSAHLCVPRVDILFYGDNRWWLEIGRGDTHKAARIVSTSGIGPERLLSLHKEPLPGLSADRQKLRMRRSSVSGAINLAVHLGVAKIVLLGLDGRKGADGRRHSHGVRYPWPLKPKAFDEQIQEFSALVEPLRAAGVETVNASPGSAVLCWPLVEFEKCLQ